MSKIIVDDNFDEVEAESFEKIPHNAGTHDDREQQGGVRRLNKKGRKIDMTAQRKAKAQAQGAETLATANEIQNLHDKGVGGACDRGADVVMKLDDNAPSQHGPIGARRQPNPIAVAMILARRITDKFPDREQPDELRDLLQALAALEPRQAAAVHNRLCAGIMENERTDDEGRMQPAFAVARALENDPRVNTYTTTTGDVRPRWFTSEVRIAGTMQGWIYDPESPLDWEDLFYAGLAQKVEKGGFSFPQYSLRERALSAAPRTLRESADDPNFGLSDDEADHLRAVADWLDSALKARAEHIAEIKRSQQAARVGESRRNDRRAFLSRLPVKPRAAAQTPEPGATTAES